MGVVTIPVIDAASVGWIGADEMREIDRTMIEDLHIDDVARAAPLTRPITVTAWRVRATDIPHDPLARIAWLDEQWLRVRPLDRSATHHDPSTEPGTASA